MMQTVAVISDIHGNLQALTDVWTSIENLGLSSETVLNAGDTVAHGDDSGSCIEFVRSHQQIISVGGNYDYNVAHFPEKQELFQEKWGQSRPDKFEYLRRASGEISGQQRKWLGELPKKLKFTFDELTLSLCHYSPIGKKIGLGTWTSDDELAKIAAESSFDIIVVGHTHTPFVRRVGKTLFVNPGSVGMSWSSPTFAVLTVDAGTVTGIIKS